ncbi:MAG: hypothetical protein K2K70_11655 [Lachnospiraceae bacterium]|nr:hypothetical protein [Lachnospiraceae bacterium]
MEKRISRNDMFVHDMVHNNPGLARYETAYRNPLFLKKRGFDAITFDLFECAQFGLLWDRYDIIRNDGKKVFPANSAMRKWAEAKKEELKESYQAAADAGLKVTFMMDIIVLPLTIPQLVPEVLDENGMIDIQKPEMKMVLDCMFDEIFTEFPQINGIYIRYGETYVGEKYLTPYHRGNNPVLGDRVDFHQFLIGYLTQKVCGEYNREIYYRTWEFDDFQYDPLMYLKVSNAIPQHEKLYFCIKHTQGDFHRTFAFNQCLNIGKHKQIVEVQAAREYEGKGAFPNYIADGVINGFEEYKWLMKPDETQSLKEVVNQKDSLIQGIWTWSRGGGWDGPYLMGKNGHNGIVEIKDGRELWADLNAYVISQWAKDTSRSDRYYAEQYAEEILGMNTKEQEIFYEICLKSAHAVLLGRGTNSPCFSFDVWWTRDQNISYETLLKNIRSAIACNALDVLLEEKERSVIIWKEMVELARKFSEKVEAKDYIIMTCEYGRLLFSLYEVMYRANALAILGNHKKELDMAICQYDDLWKEWEELKRQKPGCPTLYEKKDINLDLMGYIGNCGFDATINPLRVLLD